MVCLPREPTSKASFVSVQFYFAAPRAAAFLAFGIFWHFWHVISSGEGNWGPQAVINSSDQKVSGVAPASSASSTSWPSIPVGGCLPFFQLFYGAAVGPRAPEESQAVLLGWLEGGRGVGSHWVFVGTEPCRGSWLWLHTPRWDLSLGTHQLLLCGGRCAAVYQVLIKIRNYYGWKNPPRSTSPTFDWAPTYQLNNSTNCCTASFLQDFQG